MLVVPKVNWLVLPALPAPEENEMLGAAWSESGTEEGAGLGLGEEEEEEEEEAPAPKTKSNGEDIVNIELRWRISVSMRMIWNVGSFEYECHGQKS